MTQLARILALLTAPFLVLALSVTPAHAAETMVLADIEELVAELASTYQEQGNAVCYGWSLEIQDDGGAGGGVTTASNLGNGVPANTCPQYLQFNAYIHWTSEFSESYDSASWNLQSNVAGLDLDEAKETLEEYAGVSNGALEGDNYEAVVEQAALTLPLLAVEAGAAPPIQVEDEATAPADAVPTNGPSADWLRQPIVWVQGVLWLLFVGGALFGAYWYFVGRNHRKQTYTNYYVHNRR